MSASAPSIPGLTVVDCSGSARQRGENHGEALREAIADGLDRWATAIETAHRMAPATYISDFVSGTDFLPAIQRWTPALLDEVEGIARGSGQPWEWIYATNLLDEEWTWASSRQLVPAPGCTAVGFVPPNGPPILAQTMDINNFHDGAQAVLRMRRGDDPDLLMFTRAGMIGLTGCNADGLAVVVNNLDVLPASTTGLPVAFAIRGVLDRRSLADAVAFLGDVPHATGQHYGLAGPEGLASVEAWATGVAANSDPGPRLLHTNHPLTTDPVAADAGVRFGRSRTRERLAFLEREAGACQDLDGVQTLLSDRDVPISLDAASPSMSFGAVVYQSTMPARMRVAPGPPHLTPFHQVGW